MLNVIKTISDQRLKSYCPKGDFSDLPLVFARYRKNILLCESFYPSLHFLEISLRNSIHTAISASMGDHWLKNDKILRGTEVRKVQEAIQMLQDQRKPETVGGIIAELNLGFWVSLFDSYYDKLWNQKPRLKTVFPNLNATERTRVDISPRIQKIRKLRNRVFHYEPIWHWKDLSEQHDLLVEVIKWMSLDVRVLLDDLDRFHEVFKTPVLPITEDEFKQRLIDFQQK